MNCTKCGAPAESNGLCRECDRQYHDEMDRAAKQIRRDAQNIGGAMVLAAHSQACIDERFGR